MEGYYSYLELCGGPSILDKGGVRKSLKGGSLCKLNMLRIRRYTEPNERGRTPAAARKAFRVLKSGVRPKVVALVNRVATNAY